ncbi:hypothetical protein LINPERPRIM_LOCUS30922, partial [Linum perenne]
PKPPHRFRLGVGEKLGRGGGGRLFIDGIGGRGGGGDGGCDRNRQPGEAAAGRTAEGEEGRPANRKSALAGRRG